MEDIESAFVQLARMALEGRTESAAMLARRTLRSISRRRPDLANDVGKLLSAVSSTPTRTLSGTAAVPFDLDSRLELLREEDRPNVDVEPVWPADVSAQLESVLNESRRIDELVSAHLIPTRSLLFIGPPGVGKTLAAKWLARELKRPLLTLDLAAVMSSFLGKTGNNIRAVLEYARQKQSVLLLDEFDAIAKRRDDVAEIGELKRLVTVLVQAVDDWPAESLLIAATNHPELLDPAVWRRFDRVINFPLPMPEEVARILKNLVRPDGSPEFDSRIRLLSLLLDGMSFADIAREALRIRRDSVLRSSSETQALLDYAVEHSRTAPLEQRIAIANELTRSGYSQRTIAALTGLSRDTIRKHARHSPRRTRRRSTDAKKQ